MFSIMPRAPPPFSGFRIATGKASTKSSFAPNEQTRFDTRYRQTKGATEYERKMKTMKTVCSRGYEPALVRKVMSSYE